MAGVTEPGSASPRDRWHAEIDELLAGRDIDDVLVRFTRGGVRIDPLYTATEPEPGPDPSPRRRRPFDQHRFEHGWDVRQHHGETDLDALNDAVLADLAAGVTSIELAGRPGGWTADELGPALEGVVADAAPVALAPHADLASAEALLDWWQRHGTEPRGALGLDPVGEQVRWGGEPVTVAAASLVAARLAGRRACHGFVADGVRYADAGADEVQELAWVTATGITYLRALTAAGLSPESAAALISLRWAATADQFVTIAKLRAGRWMWGRVLEAAGVDADPGETQHHQAVTPLAMYSRRDPWVNLLRSTTAALAAVVGGADAVTTLPFDVAAGPGGTPGRRTARNTQLLLAEESHLGRWVDPAGGSWYVESLTSRLAERAWGEMQEIEADGGMQQYAASGAIGEILSRAWADRLVDLGRRAESVVGVNQFPDLDEPGPPVPAASPSSPDGRTDRLPVRRPAAPFEDLRDRSDRHTARTGDRPTIHLAAMGPLAGHTPRSTWIRNLVATAGVATTGGEGDAPESPVALSAEFTDCRARIAVLCAPDGLVATRGAAAATALKRAGAVLVVLARRPGDDSDELTRAGVDDHWYAGMDTLEALERLLATLGVDGS